MGDITIDIISNLAFHISLQNSLEKSFPDIKPSSYLQFAMTGYQKTTLVLSSVVVLLAILQLVFSLQQNITDSETQIILTDNTSGKTIEIDATNTDLDVQSIIDSFLKHEKEDE